MSDLVDRQLAALANPTRRAIIQLTLSRERSAGELADAFAMSRPGVSQHIRVLVDAQLIVERRDRQRRMYQVDTRSVVALRNQFESFWSSGLQRLKAAVEREAGESAKPARRPGRRKGRG